MKGSGNGCWWLIFLAAAAIFAVIMLSGAGVMVMP